MLNTKKIIAAIFILHAGLHGQTAIGKVDKYYASYNYYKVIEEAEKNKENANAEALRKIADSYKLTGDYSNAESCYAKLIAMPEKTAEDIYNYAGILKTKGNYAEAKSQMSAFSVLKPADKRAVLFAKNPDYTSNLLINKEQFKIKNLNLNSDGQEFGACYFKNAIVFTSSKEVTGPVYRLSGANKKPFLNLYIASADETGEITFPKPLKKLNKKLNEGPAAYNKDGNIMFYTSNNYKLKSIDGKQKLQLTEIKHVNSSYGEVTLKIPFYYNNKDYSVTHPALSADGNTLYFASDMPGGKGGIDIYKCKRNEDGSWGKPENLGDAVNTEGNEVFPFIHESGLFFFSSDGHPGLGGLDIFVAQVKDNQITNITNPGVPLNSNKDDFSFILNQTKNKGYFSSNRDGGKGDDDIYYFDLLKPFSFE